MEVIGIGALNFDRLYRVPRAAGPGEELRVLERFTGGGGSAANTIVGLARLGVKTGFIGVVGEDREGELLLEELRRERVDTEGVTRIKGRTGEIIGVVDNRGERILYAYPGVNDSLEIDASKLEYAGKARFLHLSSFVGEPSYHAQKNLLKLRNKISFSPGTLYARKGIAELKAVIKRSEVVFLNREELRLLTGEELKPGVKKLLEAGAKAVAVTLGEKGCYIASTELEETVPGYPVKVVDTTGAGDAFAAGFLYGMLQDLEPPECGKLGNKLASLCIAAMGARTGLPRREEIEDFISALG